MSFTYHGCLANIDYTFAGLRFFFFWSSLIRRRKKVLFLVSQFGYVCLGSKFSFKNQKFEKFSNFVSLLNTNTHIHTRTHLVVGG